jgi:hypothetical protein
MTKIQWRHDHPDCVLRIFNLDESKSWKGALIRGHDIAEMIAQEIWDTEAMTISKLHIVAPKPFMGAYEVTPVFEPSFSAKRMAAVEPDATTTPKARKM